MVATTEEKTCRFQSALEEERKLHTQDNLNSGIEKLVAKK